MRLQLPIVSHDCTCIVHILPLPCPSATNRCYCIIMHSNDCYLKREKNKKSLFAFEACFKHETAFSTAHAHNRYCFFESLPKAHAATQHTRNGNLLFVQCFFVSHEIRVRRRELIADRTPFRIIRITCIIQQRADTYAVKENPVRADKKHTACTTRIPYEKYRLHCVWCRKKNRTHARKCSTIYTKIKYTMKQTKHLNECH